MIEKIYKKGDYNVWKKFVRCYAKSLLKFMGREEIEFLRTKNTELKKRLKNDELIKQINSILQFERDSAEFRKMPRTQNAKDFWTAEWYHKAKLIHILLNGEETK